VVVTTFHDILDCHVNLGEKRQMERQMCQNYRGTETKLAKAKAPENSQAFPKRKLPSSIQALIYFLSRSVSFREFMLS